MSSPRSSSGISGPHALLCGAAAALLLAVATGCNQSSTGSPTPPAETAVGQEVPTVAVVKPERTTLRRAIRQPGAIQAFEQTPIFAKIAGYVRKWQVDIGDRVRQGDVLAELWVPEMEVELKQKDALVKQAEAEITQAKEAAAAAEASFRSAEAQVREAEASRLRVQANHRRMKSQYERLAKVGQSGAIDRENVEETRYGLEAAEAALEEVEARIKSAQAVRDESRAKRDKAQADVSVAEAHLEVAKQNRDQVKALLQYTRLTAPFDGVVTRRHINTGDFVQPPTGGKGEPLFVVERRDVMRIFVDVPESDAGWVQKGAAARVRVQALSGPEFVGEVARTSYSLDRTARTLLAEIDLPNPQDRLRSGMYASATITAAHPNVLTLPAAAVLTQGDVTQGYQTYCFLVEDGKARRTPIEVGARNAERVEVLKKQAKPGQAGSWVDFTGEEVVIAGNLAGLSDGQAISLSPGSR
jgi:HlyD family secretion protein